MHIRLPKLCPRWYYRSDADARRYHMEYHGHDSLAVRYLDRAAQEIKKGKPLCIVMGNEAADLDSMATSLVYASFRNALGKTPFHVPVIPIVRNDFPLRTEAVWLFSRTGIDAGRLIFKDDAALQSLLAQPENTIILVDHNKPSKAFEGAAAAVTEILDHHEDEKLFPDARKTIAPVGSTATLAAEKILEADPSLMDTDTALLLLGTILLDTVNLDPEAKRVTPRDAAAAEELFTVTGADQQELFDQLQFEKFNVSSLSSRDILRKDYKEFQFGKLTCGISSTLLSFDQWISKDAKLPQAFKDFAAGQKLDILIAMGAYTDPDFKREMAVYSEDAELRKQVASCLNDAGTQLSPYAGSLPANSEAVDFYTQRDLSKSRKKVQPILAECLSS